MRPDCNIERNLRIYRARQKGVSYVRLAQLAGVSTERVRQIVAFTEQQLKKGDADYTAVFSDN